MRASAMRTHWCQCTLPHQSRQRPSTRLRTQPDGLLQALNSRILKHVPLERGRPMALCRPLQRIQSYSPGMSSLVASCCRCFAARDLWLRFSCIGAEQPHTVLSAPCLVAQHHAHEPLCLPELSHGDVTARHSQQATPVLNTAGLPACPPRAVRPLPGRAHAHVAPVSAEGPALGRARAARSARSHPHACSWIPCPGFAKAIRPS